MATLNAATYYRLDHLVGSVTPAKLADLLILDNLEDARYFNTDFANVPLC